MIPRHRLLDVVREIAEAAPRPPPTQQKKDATHEDKRPDKSGDGDTWGTLKRWLDS